MSLATTLAGLDPWTAGRVVVSAGFYGAALLAVGGLLFRFAFPTLPPREARVLGRTTLIAAWAGIGLMLLLWPLQAAYLGGGSLAAASDPLLLRIVVESAQGHRLCLAVGGLLLQTSLVGERWRTVRHGVSLVGAMLVLLAFTQVGHTRSDPRMGVLLFLHLLLAAFWLAALMPLYRLAGHERDAEQAARLLRRFGQFGLVLIPLLLIAGGGLVAWLMDGRPALLRDSDYGQVLSVKLVLVALLLALGAGNKWCLVPAVRRAVPGARRRLRRSIATEAVLMGLLLLTVALLFTTSSPLG